MRLKKLILKNFRGYREETQVLIDSDLTAITGKNDAGKSSIVMLINFRYNILICNF